MSRKYTKRIVGNQIDLGVQVNCTALYIRVSTEKQADEGFSLDAQEARLRAYCAAQQWSVCEDHLYVDAGLSGTTTDREALQRMMQAAKDGAIKRIVTMKLDRLARNTKDFLAIVETLQGYGCDLVLIKESFDTSTPQGKFALTMFSAIAELEAATITERVMTGKAQKAGEGGYNGSQCPFGYKYSEGQFQLDTAVAGVIQELFTGFVAGHSLSSLAKDLNDNSIATVRGGKWHTSTVRYMLRNGFYAGLSQWDATEVEGTHPALISRDLYEAAHRRLQALKPGPAASQ